MVEDDRRLAYVKSHIEARRGGARPGRRRPRLLRLVAARQLRVGVRLRQALRDRLRRLPDAAAHPEAERALVPRPDRGENGGAERWPRIDFRELTKPSPAGRWRSTTSTSRSRTASSWSRRPVRVGQDDRPAHRRRARAGDERRGLDRRRGHERRAADGPEHRDGLPELRALPAHDRLREHGVRAQAPRSEEARDRAARERRRADARASTTCSSGSRPSSRADSGSASPWAARSCASPTRS